MVWFHKTKALSIKYAEGFKNIFHFIYSMTILLTSGFCPSTFTVNK